MAHEMDSGCLLHQAIRSPGPGLRSPWRGLQIASASACSQRFGCGAGADARPWRSQQAAAGLFDIAGILSPKRSAISARAIRDGLAVSRKRGNSPRAYAGQPRQRDPEQRLISSGARATCPKPGHVRDRCLDGKASSAPSTPTWPIPDRESASRTGKRFRPGEAIVPRTRARHREASEPDRPTSPDPFRCRARSGRVPDRGQIAHAPAPVAAARADYHGPPRPKRRELPLLATTANLLKRGIPRVFALRVVT